MSKSVALIFPGQGAQAVGMGKEFYDSSAEAKAVIDQADGVIEGLKNVMFDGPEEKLTQTAFAQPGIFAYSMAALAALKAHPKSKNLNFQFACGLSLGEYSALCATGALSLEKTIDLVRTRGQLMDEACKKKKGAMAAVIGMDAVQLKSICDQEGAEVANYNSPDQIVITGEESKVLAASEKIKQAGAKRVIPLSVSGAFHSSLMQSAADQFKTVLKTLELQSPKFAILSNVDGLPQMDPKLIKDNLTTQITSSVQWVKTIETIAREGVDTFLEIGPGTVLKGLIRKINKDLTVYNIQKPEDLDNLEVG